MRVGIDWPALRDAAVGVMRRAYAPYSNFPVGAAGLVDDGRVIVACNVENASYGLSVCAECGLVSTLHATGGGRLVAVACVDSGGAPLMPCGRCRQLLYEQGGPDCLVDAPGAPVPIRDLLPRAFDATELERVRVDMFGDELVTVPASSVPAALGLYVGKGTVFVHPDVKGAYAVWTAYWERSSGFGGDLDEPTGIIEEGPQWADAADAVAWGRARTPRVVVVDASGTATWAGRGERPASIEKDWIE
jgi:cytidine deaminase